MRKPKSTVEWVPLFDVRVSAAAKREVAACLNDGWLSTGPRTTALEKGVMRLTGAKHAVAVSSATAGLELALAAVGARRGTQVVTTPFTFVATVEAIMRNGAEPVFADIDPHTLNVDPDEVARKVTRATAAILPVDLAGVPCNYKALKELCDSKTIPLIADSAHALGASYGRKSIATTADAAVYSFYSTKNLTCGEGGMVVSNHRAFAEVVRRLSRHGMTTNAHERQKRRAWAYDVEFLGSKANLSDVLAAIGLGQLTVFASDQKKREALADRYNRNLAHLRDLLELPAVAAGSKSSWHLYIVKLNLDRLKVTRDAFIDQMKRQGIECGVHYQGIYDFSYYRDQLGVTAQYLPNAAYATRRVVTLPLYPALKPAVVDRICEAVNDIMSRFAR